MSPSTFCNQCGSPLDQNARFCAKCGAIVAGLPTAASVATQQPPVAMTAAAAPAPISPLHPVAAPPAVPPQYGVMPGAVPQPGYPGAVPGVLPYAGFWLRVGAYFVDLLVVIVPLIILSLIPILGILLNIVGVWLYYALQESSERQATIGKRALNIYVTDMNGQRLSFGNATGRYFAKILSGLILGIGYMMAGFTEKKQALHDMVAGTLVMRR